MNDPTWALALFHRSILKQQKWQVLSTWLGPTQGLRCLDLGADNGIISYLLRQQGGDWASADLDPHAVDSIRSLVHSDVHQLHGGRTPFADGEFDRVVIVDLLEHLEDDHGFLEELGRIMRPGGELIINVPHVKPSFLRRFRLAIGQTDEQHGHVRPGYTVETLRRALGDVFTVVGAQTYSRFFSQCVDTLVTAVAGIAKRGHGASSKGLVITERDVDQSRRWLTLYGLIYPIMWLMAQLDRLLLFRSGYLLVVKARRVPVPAAVACEAIR